MSISISISFSTLYSPTPSSLPFKSPLQTRLLTSHRSNSVPLHSSLKTHFNPKRINGFSGNNLRGLFGSKLGCVIKAENEDKSGVEEGENEARGMSTMPERFRYLNQEAPDPPVRWPYFVGISFLFTPFMSCSCACFLFIGIAMLVFRETILCVDVWFRTIFRKNGGNWMRIIREIIGLGI